MTANKTNRPKPGETAVKVLLFDVESSPNIGYTWGKFEQNVIEFIKERQIMCFSWKWLGERKIHALAMPMMKGYRRNPDDNRALIIRLHELISQADVVVGHNIDDFDEKMSNTGFIKHGLKPPPPHKTVDTLRFARHKFRFNSNRLGDLGKFLGLGDKVRTGGFDLWKRCLAGDPKAWATMVRYNKGDVRLLEKIYLKERPWMSRHPNMNALDGHDGCPHCKSRRTHLIRRGWTLSINGGKRMRFRCKDCGKWSSGVFVKNSWRFK